MRRTDWVSQLWLALEAAKDRPFFYGACVQLAAECVDAMTDTRYRELIPELAKAQPDITMEALTAQVGDELGAQIALNQAGRGDVMLLNLENGPALGICTGDRVAVAGELKGVVYLRRARAVRAWRVA